MGTYVVLRRSITELADEDVVQLATAPPLFAVCVVCEMIRRDLSQSIFQIVWSWPGIAGCDEHCRGFDERRLLFERRDLRLGHFDESHSGVLAEAALQKERC